MINERYITGSVNISNGMVAKNNAIQFKNIGCKLNDLLPSAYQHFHFQYPKFYKMDNLSKLGWLASEILLTGSFEKDNYKPGEIGVFLANANSSLDNDLKYYRTIKEIPSPSVFVYTLPNIVIGEICIRNNFKGEHAFYIQEAFDADFLEQQINSLMNNNVIQAAVCGWVDVLDEEYKAVLFLVEKKPAESTMLFSVKVMNTIFEKN